MGGNGRAAAGLSWRKVEKEEAMRMRWLVLAAAVGVLLLALASCTSFGPASLDPMASDPTRHVEVLVQGALTDAVIADLGVYGKVTDTFAQIGGVAMDVRESALVSLRNLEYVVTVGERADRNAYDYSGGVSTWDLDIMNVTNPPTVRAVSEGGQGVYVAVLDTGLVGNWRDYFPVEQIAVDYARAFAGGGSEKATISDPTNAWERDTEGHGTHVTSTVLGYWQPARTVNGAAPLATVIPVKVLKNNGSGWSTVIAHGILYIADLKAELNAPVVINMSLGGSTLSALEAAAIDYAIEKGVIVVASAGNEGEQGMGYPGAYAPVISVGSAGWTREWSTATWWRDDVVDPTDVLQVYVSDFSSRELPGQDLDVLAPGSWIVGPYLGNGASHPPFWAHSQNGQYYYLGGTSMASPHVAGLVALMLEKAPTLSASEAESILEATALAVPAPGSASVNDGSGRIVTVSWGPDAVGAGLVQADAALAAVP
jgi:subtilisin family serine protease